MTSIANGESGPETQSPPGALGRPTGARKWLFRIASATLVPALLLGFLEAGLRVVGYGYPTSFFLERDRPAGGPILTENLEFGRRFFPPNLVRAPLTITLPVDKPPSRCRIFVLGESAALGIPDPSTSFARILEVMLRDRFPGSDFEVVNTSMVAINSNVALPIARDCARQGPDFFIVHLGNNEVVGPFGAAGVIGAHSPSLFRIRANLLARTTRTGQLLDDLSRLFGSGANAPRYWGGMGMFLKSQVRADDPRLIATYGTFRQNLDDICRVGVNAGAKVIVCTIPVNLKDCPPFASLHAPGLSAENLKDWQFVYDEGISLESAGNYAEAVRRYDEAARIDGTFAELPYRLGRCHAALGRTEEAVRDLTRARDLDTLRFRADTAINATIRDVAMSRRKEGIYLADAERDLAASAADGIPGDDYFYEHVHMTFEGNYRLARSVFRKVAALLPEPVGAAARSDAAPLSERECAARLAYSGWKRYHDTAEIAEMIKVPPFTNQLGAAEREGRFDERLGELRAYTRPDAVQEAIQECREALRHAPHDSYGEGPYGWMLRMHLARLLTESGDLDGAVEEYRTVLRGWPHCYLAHHKLGTIFLKRGKYDEATAEFRAALRTAPDFSPAHYGLAEVLAEQGDVKDAIALYAERVDREPDRADALSQMAGFLGRVGRPKKARECLAEAIRLEPDDAPLRVQMGDALARGGDLDAAIGQYEEVLRIRPHWRAMADHLAKLRKVRDDEKPPLKASGP